MAVVGALLWTAAILAVQSPQPSPSNQAPLTPTALIVGRVVDASSGRPVAGAIVSLNGGVGLTPATAADPRNLGNTRARAMTNASGQFVFRRLLEGRFVLTATKPGYAEGAYGRRKPGGSQGSLVLALGERAGDVVIPMWRNGSITGSVVDEAGEPLMGVQVRVFSRRYVAGRPRLTQGPTVQTDDRGVYRVASLVPGEYLVGFVAREISLPIEIAEMSRAPMNTSDPKIRALALERSSLGGMVGYPGMPGVVAVGGVVRGIDQNGPAPPSASDSTAMFIYPTQFYPGVPSVARATVVTLASGQERENVDFALRPVRASRVSGVLVGADGPVPNTALRLVSASDDFQSDLEASVTMTGASGEFTLLGVPAGQYTLKVLRVPRPAPPGAAQTTQVQVGSTMTISTSGSPSAGPPPIPDDSTMYAEVPIAVADRDVTDVIVPLQRGARLTGRLEFEGGRDRPDGAALARVPILPERADAASIGEGPFMSIPPGRADESGAFKTYGLPPGKYIVRVGGAPPGWTVKSVTSEGRDISETPIDLRGADLASVVITFTDRPTKLTGVARSGEGNADPDALIVVFPADSAAWTDYGLNPRRVRSTRTTKSGAYTFTGLPAGDYCVAAIKEEAYGQWQDPQVLEELARRATQVRLADGEEKTQDLKTLGGAR